MKFKKGDLVTPTEDSPWINEEVRGYLTFGKVYQVKRVTGDYVYTIRDDGVEDGFPYLDSGSPYFKSASLIQGDEFSEQDIAKAIEFIES